MKKLLLFLILIPNLVFATHTITRKKLYNGQGGHYIEEVRVAWTAESGGAVTEIPLVLWGDITAVEFEPGWSAYGGSAPTDNYDVKLYITQNGGENRVDHFASGAANLDFQSQLRYTPTSFDGTTGATYQHLVGYGMHYLSITGNTNESANGSVVFYLDPHH